MASYLAAVLQRGSRSAIGSAKKASSRMVMGTGHEKTALSGGWVGLRGWVVPIDSCDPRGEETKANVDLDFFETKTKSRPILAAGASFGR